jgi:hypothetical protein
MDGRQGIFGGQQAHSCMHAMLFSESSLAPRSLAP